MNRVRLAGRVVAALAQGGCLESAPSKPAPSVVPHSESQADPSLLSHSRQGLLGAGLFFTMGALLMLEVTLTRIFSVVMWYHFAFFAISVALFGLAASG